MAEIKVEVTDADGITEVVLLELDLNKLTMREAVTIEEMIGPEMTDQLMSGVIAPRPTVLRAILYAKLKTQRPSITLEGWDIDMVEAASLLEGDSPKDPGPTGSKN